MRYSGLDLTDGVVAGGELNDVTLGLNWYLNAHSRAMVNYIWSDLKDVGVANILFVRFQVDF